MLQNQKWNIPWHCTLKDEHVTCSYLVGRSFIYLFEQLDRRKEEASFVIKASYLEIYNEKENTIIMPIAQSGIPIRILQIRMHYTVHC